MKVIVPLIWAVLILGLSPTGVAAGPIWDGVFSVAQVSRGEAAYGEFCLHCHKFDLAGNGDLIPPIGGPGFIEEIKGITFSDLYAYVTDNMPLDDPRSLAPQTYIDVLAYILNFSGYPTGEVELGQDPAILRSIVIELQP